MTSAVSRAGSRAALGLLALGLAMLIEAEPRILPERLDPGVPVKAQLAPGQTHRYVFSVEKGNVIDLRLVQRGIEVDLALEDPGRQGWLEIHHPLPGRVVAPADETGDLEIAISLSSTAAGQGQYEITLEPARRPSATEMHLAAAVRALAEGDRLWEAGSEEALKGSLVSYQRLLSSARRSGDPDLQALADYRLGTSLGKLRRLDEALRHYEAAGVAYSRMGRFHIVANLWSAMASIQYDQGDVKTALGLYRKAYGLYEKAFGRLAEWNAASTRANIALCLSSLGEMGQALDANEDALEKYERLGGPVGPRITILLNLASLHLGIGQPEKAESEIRRVQNLLVGERDSIDQARALSNLAELYYLLERAQESIRTAREAITLAQEAGDRQVESYTLVRLARSLIDEGRLQEAEDSLRKALLLAHDVRDLRTEAQALANLGIVLGKEGRAEEGLHLLDRSLLFFEALDDPNALSLALYEKANIQQALGRRGEAGATLRKALQVSEELFGRAGDRLAKASLTADRRSHVQLQVELLMQAYEQRQDPDLLVEAFEFSEGARARTLLEFLIETQSMRENENPRLRRLDRILDARMQEWQVLKGTPVSDEEQADHQKRLEDLEEEIQRRVAERDRLYSEREREGSPLLWRRPLELSEIQRDLLGSNTVLLSYSLGEARSFVWVVSSNSFDVFELPPESEISGLVRQARAFLGQPHDWKEKRARPVLRRLSEALIEPVQGAIAGKTLLISPDGSLNTLPFALLTESPEDDSYLVDDHAILIVPSMSILKNLHDSLQWRPRAPGVVAILADPIFSRDDERIHQKTAAQGNSPVAALAELDQLGFGLLRGSRGLNDRLTNSAEEGEAILRLAPPGRSMLALGADANLDLVRSGELGGYQYIHIASHGLPSSESDLSSLVLSRFDEHGRPRAWRLPAYEISQLDLPAEMVVLSACETGLIEENGREEVSGLSRAFLYAGARRVVATLWNVDDRATTELMIRFYRALWKEGLPPAEALRKAQVEMRKTEWAAPPFWAGFVIQGED